jgi:hypothetical protein
MLHLLLSSLNLPIDKASQTSNDTQAPLPQNCSVDSDRSIKYQLLREALESKTK